MAPLEWQTTRSCPPQRSPRVRRNVQCKFCHHFLLLLQGPSGTKTCNTALTTSTCPIGIEVAGLLIWAPHCQAAGTLSLRVSRRPVSLKNLAAVQRRTDVFYLAAGKSKPCRQGSARPRCREQIRYRSPPNPNPC